MSKTINNVKDLANTPMNEAFRKLITDIEKTPNLQPLAADTENEIIVVGNRLTRKLNFAYLLDGKPQLKTDNKEIDKSKREAFENAMEIMAKDIAMEMILDIVKNKVGNLIKTLGKEKGKDKPDTAGVDDLLKNIPDGQDEN